MGTPLQDFGNESPACFIELLYLGVSSKHQGQGIGGHILTELKMWAQEQLVSFIVTFADDNEFEDFFRKHGFGDEYPVLKTKWLKDTVELYQRATFAAC